MIKPLSYFVSDLQSGSRPRGGVRGISSGIPSVGGEHLNDLGSFNFSSIKFVSKEFADSMTKGQVRYGDILIVKDGATTGKVSFVDRNFPYPVATINEHVFILRSSDKFDSKLLFWYLWSDEGQAEIRKNFQGSAQGGINRSFLGGVNIPEIPQENQRRLLSTLDKTIPIIWVDKDKLAKTQKLLTSSGQSVLFATITGKLTEKWRERHQDIEDAKSLLLKIKRWKIDNAESKKNIDRIENVYSDIRANSSDTDKDFGIPDTWAHCKIDHIGQVVNGSTPSRKISSYWKGDIPWVSSGEVTNNFITTTREKITKEGYDNSSVKLLPKGTVLLAMIGEGKTRGQTSILDIEATTNQNIAAIVIDHKQVLPEYLWFWFRTQYLTTRNYGSGSGPQALSCARVRELPFVLPPLLEQVEIVSRLKQLFETLELVEDQIKKSESKIDKLTKSILAKAFMGEL